MAKINRVEELPDWFDINKYTNTKNFKAAEWVEQLEIRHQIFQCLPKKPLTAEEKAENESLGESLDLLFVSEDIHHTRTTPTRSQRNSKAWVLDPKARPVKPLSFLEQREQLVNDWRAFHDGKAPQWLAERWEVFNKNCKWDFYNPSSDEEIHRVNQLREPFFLTEYSGDNMVETPVISIDLRTTDSVLVEAFEVWLKEMRALRPEVSKRNRPAYNDWARYGLLPYLDLLIWSTETENHIPYRIYSAAVSRHYDMGESAFSKTVVPLAKNLMTDLSDLRALAASEVILQPKKEDFES